VFSDDDRDGFRKQLNMSKINTSSPNPTAKNSTASVRFVITRDQRQALHDLGYSKADVNAMTPDEAHETISKGVTKSHTSAAKNSTSQPAIEKIIDIALRYSKSGLSIIPVRADGTKKPALDSWKEYEARPASQKEMRQWFGRQNHIGIGIICGPVSGNLEAIDIDDPEIASAFLEALNEYEPVLAAQLVIVKTPRGGAHIVYRCERIEGNQHLALREIELGDLTDAEAKRLKAYRRKSDGQWCKRKALIETRGEGGYFIAEGSHVDCHPTKKPYRIESGSLESIPSLVPDEREILLGLARSFNEVVPPEKHQTTPELGDDLKPGEDYNQRGDVAALLRECGWTLSKRGNGKGEGWIRPGGDRPSATLFDNRVLYNFSTNVAELQPDCAHSPFALYAALKHNGDFHAAGKALYQLGFGTHKQTQAQKGKGDTSKVGDTDGWEAPAPLFQFDKHEFPVDALPTWHRTFVESLAYSTQTPIDLAGLMSLAVCSAAVARNVRVKARQGWEEPLNIFAAVALPPANRKSQVVTDVTRPLFDYERDLIIKERDRIAAEKSEYNILVQELAELERKCAKAEPCDRDGLRELAKAKARELSARKMPVSPKMIVDDVTAEVLATILSEQDGRIALFSAEGGIFDTLAGRYANGTPNIDVLLKGHSGDDLRVDRRDRSEHIEKPALTIGLAVQPDVLRGLIEKPGFRGRGLIGRFLYGMPNSTIGQRKIRPTAMTDEIRLAYHKNVKLLAAVMPFINADGKSEPRLIRFSKAADDLLASFEEEIEPMLGNDGELAFIGDWGGKLAGATVRIAGILHLAQHAESLSREWPVEITTDTLKEAIKIGRYLISHARMAYAEMAADQKIEDAKLVLRWIEKTGSIAFSKRDVFEGTKSRFKQVTALDPALKILEDHGYIQLEELPPKIGAGRKPSPRFLVNPFASASLPPPPPH